MKQVVLVRTCQKFLMKTDHATQANIEVMQIFNSSPIRVLGCVPWKIELIATRAIDMAKHLNADIINTGEIRLSPY